MKTTRATTTIRLIATLAAAGLACGAYAGPRAPVATPYGAVVSDYDPGTGIWHAPRGGTVDLQAAADFIVSQQCLDGGWGFPTGCSTTFHNITAPIAGGLLAAFPGTGDIDHLNSAIAGGNFDLLFQFGNSSPRFGAFTAWFMNELSEATGDNTYADHAATGFFGPLDAGMYGDPATMDTADWIMAVQTGGGRDAQWINLRPWEFHLTIATAEELGTTAQSNLFLGALLDGLDTLDNTDPGSVFSDIIGFAGGVRGLGLSGTTSFAPISSPLHPLINGIDNLTDLANALAGLQNPDGSWNWHSNLVSPGASDKDTQTTAYAVLALEAAQEATGTDYSDEIAMGRNWLGTMQDVDGGFFNYPGTTDKNTEVVAEATAALSSSAGLSLNTTMCEATGTLTVTIDMSDTAVDIVGGQFFLEYDMSALTFVSADPGTGDFDGEVFESVSGNQIDYAVGVSPFSDPGSNQAQTMATLTFTVNGENCTPESGLVSFRSSTPPSRLTDEVGNPVLPQLFDLNEVSFDQTDPVVTVPADINVNADAGMCTAVLDFTNDFSLPVPLSANQTPGAWYPDRFPPDAFESAMFDGDDRLHHGISVNDSAANRPGQFSSAFYNTQGRKYDTYIEIGQTWSIDLYIPSGWASDVRRADLWATTRDAVGNISGFPILGFTSNDPADDVNPNPSNPTPRFRVFVQDTDQNAGNGYQPGWVDLGLPGGFSYDRWWTLETELTASTYEFRVYDDLGNLVLSYSDGTTFDSIRTSDLIVQAYNFGESYDVYWDNFQAGGVSPTVSDNCGVVDLTYERSDNASLSLADPFPSGTTTITWTAIDPCGNSSSDVQTVTVNGVNDLAVDVELDQVSTSVDRCITFELTPAGGGTPVVVEETLSFTAGLASQTIEVPCGAYECITARDTLHTLQQRDDDDFGIVGTAYVADFTTSGGNDALRGGNYNDDEFIDILDFGIFIGQFGQMIGADTPCPVTAPHADASGNGEVDTPDFTFITTQFLAQSEPACPGATPLTDDGGPIAIDAQRTGPVESITVAELAGLGMAHLATADLNHDGVLDQLDIAAFFGGALPDHLADVTGDGVVDLLDMQFMAGAFHTGDLAGDVNNDGRMDLADITFVIERVGMTFGG